MAYFNEPMETMGRAGLNALIEDRIQYTVRYAEENSPFYSQWFRENGIDVASIRTHEDLARLPIISGQTIRESQPPVTENFRFRSVGWPDVFTIHETSGTSGTPKSFFLTYQDWQRYAEKYARFFVAQGFGMGDRLIVCASYGMNVGANTMTLAAHRMGMTIVPFGKCSFPLRTIKGYKPTGILGSVFKLLRLARRMKAEGMEPRDSGVKRLVSGGESFAKESREYVEEIWGCKVFNTYGSTEGTMCGECAEQNGLHVPEDMVHLDVYDPTLMKFVPDGECGRMVLTTLLPVGGKCGTLLINYDTEDTTVVMSREKCACGRTHMRIFYPQRESETVWVAGNPFNRVDVESGVFQRDNMEYLTGEYEAFIDRSGGSTIMKLNLECFDPDRPGRRPVEERFTEAFLKYKPGLARAFEEDKFRLSFDFLPPGKLEFYAKKGRPKRLVDRR
ncbi:coenzyme F390 synthetase [Methanocella paludicola SANAE]|uniref:Coenzyme F390 synthetase n=1 Tax=Methanocella paludicola (strain DSM 17711 / JCM 13418 / NBRC 101707 / SANAE) TaxID=304371 RepID=D1Z153_METPS|nr:coenzyme F390 synthetase [Methanocella paludicola]BAI62425.1 coenzyme F390 synthetase [Methanocella paludicola SANAE]